MSIRIRAARHHSPIATSDQLAAVRRGLAELNPAASASISGEDAARPEDLFAPSDHIHALDPATTLVLGTRGAGKSFWASALSQDETRALTAALYPRLKLDRVIVKVGFSGGEEAPITPELVEELVPFGQEGSAGRALWRASVAHALREATGRATSRISHLLGRVQSTEEWREELLEGTHHLQERGDRLLILFDAIDALSTDWGRLRALLDELLRLAWGLRGTPSIRVKLFLRPDQLKELDLRFIELSKLRADAAELDWDSVDLYGMLFARLGLHADLNVRAGFAALLSELRLEPAPQSQRGLRDWLLSRDPGVQRRLFERLAGLYMGAGPRKGKTYDWPPNHLADGRNEVTPRSFLTLIGEAARQAQRRQYALRDSTGTELVIAADGIRDGLRAASRARVDQLEVEYPWVPRALSPLARLKVPNKPSEFFRRWREESTLEAINRAARERRFLPPLPNFSDGSRPVTEAALAERMIGMGLLTRRDDGRLDMPDLFRVGADLLRKGGVPPL